MNTYNLLSANSSNYRKQTKSVISSRLAIMMVSLFLMMCGGSVNVWGEAKTISSWTFTGNNSDAVVTTNAFNVLTANEVTFQLATAPTFCTHLYLQGNWKCYKDADTNPGLRNISSAKQMVLIPNLKTNDKITITVNSTDYISDSKYTGVTNEGKTEIKYTMEADGNFYFYLANSKKPDYPALKSISISRDTENYCPNPTPIITGAVGTNRKFTLSCKDRPDAEIYYSESELTTATGGSKYTGETTTSAATIWAYAKTSEATSDVISFETGVGTELTLKAPAINITKFHDNQETQRFNPVYTFSSDQSTVLGTPSPTYKYSINGTDAKPGSSYTPTEACTLTVTAYADGYIPNSTTISIETIDFLQSYYYDFETLTSHSSTTVADQTNVNSVGCQAYEIASDAISELTISMNHLWKITANKSYGLYARAGKGSITYNGYFPDKSCIICYNPSGAVLYNTNVASFSQYGHVTSMGVYIPAAAPVKNADLQGSYTAYVGINKSITFDVDGATDIKWYRNTSATKEGAKLIDGANSTTLRYTVSEAGTEYIYCVASNAAGSVQSSIVQVTSTDIDLYTTDFTTWGTEQIRYATEGDAVTKVTVDAAELDVKVLAYPYDLTGYMGKGDSDKLTFFGGMHTTDGSACPLAMLNLKEGDIIIFKGNNLTAANIGFNTTTTDDRGTCDVSYSNTEVQVTMTSAGHLAYWIKGAALISSITMPKKSTPTITTNLDSYRFAAIASGTTALTIAATSDNAVSYLWYKNSKLSTIGGEKVSQETASINISTAEKSNAYYYCVVKDNVSGAVAVSNVMRVVIATAEFRDFEIDLSKNTDYGLTAAEAVAGQQPKFGIIVNADGTKTRVETTAAEYSSANVKILAGKYKNTTYGLQSYEIEVPVTGTVRYEFGMSDNGKTVEVLADGNAYTTVNNNGAKWSSNKSNVSVGYYTGDVATLTFKGSGYLPYLKVMSVDVPACSTPIISISNYDVATKKYTVTITGQTGATIYYTLDGTTPKADPTGTPYTAAFAVDPSTEISAIAAMTDWENSPISTKKTLGQPNPDEPEVVSKANGTMGDNVGITYTVEGAYVGGGANNLSDGLKFKTNGAITNGTKKGFRVKVNPGFTIVGIDVEGQSNNSSSTTSIDKIFIDNVQNTSFTAQTLPTNKSKTTFSIADIAASNNIEFECSGYNQANIKLTLHYAYKDDDIATIKVNDTAMDAAAFKAGTLTDGTAYATPPTVTITTVKGHETTLSNPDIDGKTYTYTYKMVSGTCKLTLTNVALQAPVVNWSDASFSFSPKGHPFTLSGKGTMEISIDGGAWQTYDPAQQYYAIHSVNSRVTYGGENSEAKEYTASTDYDKAKPFAAWIYKSGYNDQNIVPEPLEVNGILDGLRANYNVVPMRIADGDNIMTVCPTIASCDLVVISEMVGGSSTLTTSIKENLAGVTNVLDMKLFTYGSSSKATERWGWGTPTNKPDDIITVSPTSRTLQLLEGVTLNEDNTISLWTSDANTSLHHVQAITLYSADAPAFTSLLQVDEHDMLHYHKYENGKVMIGFGLSVNDYTHYHPNVTAIIRNIGKLLIAGTDLDESITSLATPVISDNSDGSATITTSTTLATIYYSTTNTTAEAIKSEGKTIRNGKTIRFAQDVTVRAIAEMEGMATTAVGEGAVAGKTDRTITRTIGSDDNAEGATVTHDYTAGAKITIPYNQTFKKNGYTVTSWKDQTTGVTYAPGQKITMDQDLVLVAQWTKNTKSLQNLTTESENQRRVTWHFLHKDGAPWFTLGNSGMDGILVGQVHFKDGTFIDVPMDINCDNSAINPLDNKSYPGKFNNSQTNSRVGHNGAIQEYTQVKTGTQFIFPSVYGMKVNYKPVALIQENSANVHVTYITASTLTNAEGSVVGTIDNAGLSLGSDGATWSVTNDNFKTGGGNFSYTGNDSTVIFTSKESSCVYQKDDCTGDWTFNHGSVFMESMSVVYPGLFDITTTLNPEKSVISNGASAVIAITPEKPGNTGGKYAQGQEVIITVTPSYAYQFNTLTENSEKITSGLTTYDQDNTLPEDGAQYIFNINSNRNLTVNLSKLETLPLYTGTLPANSGRIDLTPAYTTFATGKKAILKAVPKVGYEFKGWAKDADGHTLVTSNDVIINGDELTITITSKTAGNRDVVYYAVFEEGKKGTVNYDLANAQFYEADGTTPVAGATLTDDEKKGFPSSMTASAMVIPTYYTLYKEGYTLDYWVDKENATKKYTIGTAHNFDTENETRTICPVFRKNSVDFIYRTTAADITWELRANYYAQTMNYPKNTSLHYSTHATINRSDVIDVPLTISTGTKGSIDNTSIDEWCGMGEGTTITLPSGLGATFTLSSFAKITSTTINGDTLENYTTTKENGITVYHYTYTTTSGATEATLKIGNDFSYYKYIRAQVPAANKVDVTVLTSDALKGTASLVSAREKAAVASPTVPYTQNGTTYTMPLGTHITVEARRNRLYDIDHWEDAEGNTIVTDAAKGITVTHYPAAKPGEVTSTVDMRLTSFVTTLKAVYKDHEQYQINYTAGLLATGIAPAVQVIENSEKFQMPSHNQHLFYEGHTLKYWKDAKGNRYDYGQEYTATEDLNLSPVFEVNEFSLMDIAEEQDATITWPLATKDGAADINYRGSSGIIVEQLSYNGKSIDLRMDIKTSGTSNRAYNNTNENYCLVTDGVEFTVPTSPGCEITLVSYSEKLTTTAIAGATSKQGTDESPAYTCTMTAAGGYSATVKYAGQQSERAITFHGDAPSFTAVSITYHNVEIDMPSLEGVTLGGVALTAEQMTTLRNYKKLENVVVSTPDDEMPKVEVTTTAQCYQTITQPTVVSPQATIILRSLQGIVLGTYNITFNVTKAVTPTLVSVRIDGQEATNVDGAWTVPNAVKSNSTAEVTFSNRMAASTITTAVVTPAADQTGTFSHPMSAEEGKTLTYNYWSLEHGKVYHFTINAGTLKDVYGNAYNQDLAFKFTIKDVDETPEHRPFDFVVSHTYRREYDHKADKDATWERTEVLTNEAINLLHAQGIATGTVDEAIAAANASGTEGRYRIFIPDGEYQLHGNANINPGRDFSDNNDGALVTKSEFNSGAPDYMSRTGYNNGMTWISRAMGQVSIVGQSQENTVLYNKPYFYGMSYTSLLEVRKGISNCYLQDMTLENRYNAFQVEKQAAPSGQAVAFYDRGVRTIAKRVKMMSYQDTFITDGSHDDNGRGYYEDCTVGGTVDFICGSGNMWWENCTFLMRYRANNNIAAPRQTTTQKWGYVFSNCTIDADATALHDYASTASINEGVYHLGRPWDNSPALTYLNTTMKIAPKGEGWMNMKAGMVLRFQEYGSRDRNGLLMNLSERTTRLSSPVAGSYDAVMTPEDAARYTRENVLGGNDAYNPTVYTAQRPAPQNVGFSDTKLQWQKDNEALCYFIFTSPTEDGTYKLLTVTTATEFDCINRVAGAQDLWYVVRAANQRGGLGEASQPVFYNVPDEYHITVSAPDPAKPTEAWGTVCLPANTKAPDNVKVYAAKEIVGTTVYLYQVSFLDAGKGYIIHGNDMSVTLPTSVTFRTTTFSAEHNTLLSGNSSSESYYTPYPNFYALSFKKTYKIGLYKYTGNTVGAYKAWLPSDQLQASSAKGVELSGESVETTGQSVENIDYAKAAQTGFHFVFVDLPTDADAATMDGTTDEEIYDLQGIRQQSTRQGVNIVNNRKVFVNFK